MKLDGVTPVRSLEQNEKIVIGACTAQLLLALILRYSYACLCYTRTYVRTYVCTWVCR